MPTAQVNGVRLHYELSSPQNASLVLVHGSWTSHHGWDQVVPTLSETFRVLTYDRRGHSESERPAGQGSVKDDVRDLAALIEHLGLAPAWIGGTSFGASIVLRLAGDRPDLFRGLIAHEPPLFGLLLDDHDVASMLTDVMVLTGAVVERIGWGDNAGAAEQFVETVALGPGMWAQLPEAVRKTMIENAPTFLDEARDPGQIEFNPVWLRGFSKPCLLTKGDHSPPPFAPVVEKLARTLRQAEVVTLPGAGHNPHQTHPDAFVNVILDFTRRHA